MKTRDQIYDSEARGLLRALGVYHCLSHDQIEGLFPEKKGIMDNLLTYLLYHRRIWQVGERYYASEEDQAPSPPGLNAALRVLAEFIPNVDFHSAGDYPAQIIFFANDEIFEIVYAESGREALLSHLMTDAKEQGSKYIVIVEKLDQIEKISAPNIKVYCTVSEGGEVKFYQRE